ncbi:ATPase family AAA domain-containing protein 1 [Camelus ferus]|nr:ATPase family AAA domain-containing protein 1 [Camelus ferus]
MPPPPLTLATAAADSCRSQSESSQAGRTLRLLPTQSKLKGRDLRIRALDRLALCLPKRGRRDWALELWRIFPASALPLRANPSGAVLAGQKGISCSSPLLEYNDVATNSVTTSELAEKLMKQIGVKNVKLSEYEMSIAAHLVDPLNMHVTWSDIAGLDDVITDLKDTVILPIKKKHLFENSRLLQPPKGVLLYGPPGCGKTLIAKATAKEAGCRFINLQPSTLTDKWYGESQKLAAAVFSLAIKLQPSIIFIDEIDSFLRNRSSSDHEATAMMKAQFMSLWDGLDTDHSCQVDRHVDLLEVAQETDGFSGSDLKEMCRDAALLCVREYVNSTSEESHDEDEIRPVQQQDLHRAIEKMKKSKDAAFQNVLTHVCLD